MLTSPAMCPVRHRSHDFLSPRQNELEAALEDILALTQRFDDERRATRRHHFTRPVTLMPCDPTGFKTEAGILCMGKEISATGFGFFHQQPLPHRYLLLSFAPSLDCPHRLLMRMRRCRFLGENWYESGAQFIRVVPIYRETAQAHDFCVD